MLNCSKIILKMTYRRGSADVTGSIIGGGGGGGGGGGRACTSTGAGTGGGGGASGMSGICDTSGASGILSSGKSGNSASSIVKAMGDVTTEGAMDPSLVMENWMSPAMFAKFGRSRGISSSGT